MSSATASPAKRAVMRGVGARDRGALHGAAALAQLRRELRRQPRATAPGPSIRSRSPPFSSSRPLPEANSPAEPIQLAVARALRAFARRARATACRIPAEQPLHAEPARRASFAPDPVSRPRERREALQRLAVAAERRADVAEPHREPRFAGQFAERLAPLAAGRQQSARRSRRRSRASTSRRARTSTGPARRSRPAAGEQREHRRRRQRAVRPCAPPSAAGFAYTCASAPDGAAASSLA